MIGIIVFVFFILNAIFLYLIVLGANKCKTAEEREMEHEEENQYWKDYNKK